MAMLLVFMRTTRVVL